ncbi:MAG: diaminopimelate decarboxylase [Clostridia bacterium]|nr:diaminopimelate decarboxylase [Clostridia bacterium]
MFLSEGLSINKAGHLLVENCDTVELAEKFGTPLYVMSENTIRKNCRLFSKSMKQNYKNSLVIFASKALNCLEICRIVNDEGLGLDVVSGGELYTAKKAGFPMDRVFFHGNNKTSDELKMALESKVGRIIVDNVFELDELDELAGKMGVKADIMFRIKPGVDAHTHDFVKTGQIDSKFGFALENGEAFEAVKYTTKLKNVNLTGLHCHIGSQIFDDEPFIAAAEVMLKLYVKIKKELNITLSDLNLGGGFGIKYIESDDPMAYDKFMNTVSNVIHDFCSVNSIDVPRILIEPGRAIVGEAGTTLYTVGAIKEIENIRNYVFVNGGMGDNPRYALYNADYSAIIANKADATADYTATIAGKCCESGDLIQEDTKIAKPEKGDILAVLSTGAYNYSMSSNYNRIPRPAMVMVNEDKARVVIKRETYDDIIKNDI